MHHGDPCSLSIAANQAADRGWSVFPLVPGAKRPAVRSWERRATTDTERVNRCWSTGPFNIGIATGPSGLIVVDLDVPRHDQDLPPTYAAPGVKDGQDSFAHLAERHGQPYPASTFSVRTGSGGVHLYFAAPAGIQLRNTAGALGWKIDTRAEGGYVVGAGSVIGSRAYTVLSDQAPAPLPHWLTRLLTPSVLPPQRHVTVALNGTDRRSGYLRAAVAAEQRRITNAHEGARNSSLYLAAVALGQLVAGREIGEADVTRWLFEAARTVGLADRETRQTIASGLRAGARRPRTFAHGAAA